MYERFTDRARSVMQRANQEAQRVKHEYIGTEHILLGIIMDPASVAARVLERLRINLLTIRTEIERVMDPGQMASLGTLPQTPRVKRVVELAMSESRAFNHNYVGTEHLLIGLIREGEGVAFQVLNNLGATLDLVLQVTTDILAGVTAEERELMNLQEQGVLRIRYGGVLLAMDELINCLDTQVFNAAQFPGLTPDEQRDRAMSPGFMPPVRRLRDEELAVRDSLALKLGFGSRRPHDTSPRDYKVMGDGLLVPRGTV